MLYMTITQKCTDYVFVTVLPHAGQNKSTEVILSTTEQNRKPDNQSISFEKSQLH